MLVDGLLQKFSYLGEEREHSGILSTFAFHMSTNGRRAKANRIYEALTCQVFNVKGTTPDPTHPEAGLEDLTKSHYCANCHLSLEPMARFFNRAPALGRINFEYYKQEDIQDSGEYKGKKGAGMKGFAEIMANSEEFSSCASRQLFEFVYGRAMNSQDSVKLDSYANTYMKNNGNLKSVMIQMLHEEEFHRVQE